MTDRINDLKRKATEDLMGVPVLDPRLFAELIIQECVYCARRATTGVEAANLIEENFGVTE